MVHKTEEARLIGIAGAGRGTGVTHLSLLAANYLTGCCGRTAALLEWNSHGDFQALRQALLGREGGWKRKPQRERYRFLDVDYYQGGDREVLLECMNGSYDDIIIDFGELREDIQREWLRCDVKIMAASLTEWKVGAFLEFLAKQERPDRRWIYTAAFGSEDTRKMIQRQFLVSLRMVPFSADAFLISRDLMRWFEDRMGLG